MHMFRLLSSPTLPSPRGYVALISVIMLSAIGLVITVSLLTSNILLSKTALVSQRKNEARLAATSCAEEALQNILDTGIDIGTGTVSLVGSSTCIYTIASTSSADRVVFATGYSGDATSKILIYLASSTPKIKLSSWKEVSDF